MVHLIYIGSTKRSLKIRTDQHAGRSSRTGHYLSKPDQSHVRDHADECDYKVNLSNFEILSFANDYTDMRILESLYINKHKPNLNDHSSAYPLNIID